MKCQKTKKCHFTSFPLTVFQDTVMTCKIFLLFTYILKLFLVSQAFKISQQFSGFEQFGHSFQQENQQSNYQGKYTLT